jgi:lipopolysaccharide export system protein LptA
MTKVRLKAAVLGALTLLSGVASAQIAGGGGPIDVRADRARFLEGEARVVYTGSVVAKQALSELRADTLTIEFERRAGAGTAGAVGSGVGDAQRIIAEGNVLYLTPTERARGNRAVYEYASDTITMTGDVILTRGEDVLTGPTLVIEVSKGISTIQGGRVRTVITPRGEGAAAPAPAAR